MIFLVDMMPFFVFLKKKKNPKTNNKNQQVMEGKMYRRPAMVYSKNKTTIKNCVQEKLDVKRKIPKNSGRGKLCGT
jgi:hypothetical protein